MSNGLFITATGTDIGKTYLTQKLIATFKNSFALKPIISGFSADNFGDSDTAKLLKSLGLPSTLQNIDKISPWRFKDALSPDMAASKRGEEIDFAELVKFCKAVIKKQFTLIEGVGGVMVPINRDKTVLDWISEMQIPTILVTNSYLGSLSHTLTSILALKSRGIEIRSIVINQEQGISAEDTIKSLKNFIDEPILTVEQLLDSLSL